MKEKGVREEASEAIQDQTWQDAVTPIKDLGFYLKSHGKWLNCIRTAISEPKKNEQFEPQKAD